MLKSLSAQDFDIFLTTLGQDRNLAAEKYLSLRERLESFFEWRDCENAEGLTDIVFDRVVKKIIGGENIENSEAYCVSVAKFVLLEHRREVFKSSELDENSKEVNKPESDDDEIKNKRFKCLDKCLAEFPIDKREMLVAYFDTDEKTMISTRKDLAKKLGTNLNSLRIRVCRLKTKLEKCTKECCDES